MGKTLYAVIQPPAYTEGSLLDVAYPFVTVYHRLLYPAICGYSLGNKINFFDTLEDAKDHVFPDAGIRGKVDGYFKLNSQNAVIKLDVENDKVVNVTSIYQIKEFSDALYHNEQVKQAVWETTHFQEATDNNTLNAINAQLELRYHHPHYKDSKHPKARLCRELSMKFNQENITFNMHERQNLVDLLSLYAIGSLVLSIAASDTIINSVPQLIALSSILAASSAYILAGELKDTQKEKEAYIKNGLFSSHQTEYTGPMTQSRTKIEEGLPQPPRLGFR